MSPVKLGTIIACGFLPLLLLKPVLNRKFISSAEAADQPTRSFIVNVGICLVAGLLINSFTLTVYSFPLSGAASLLIGCVITGFFIGTDAALIRERISIVNAMQQDVTSAISRRYFPMTSKFTIFAVMLTIFVSLVLIIIFTRDVEWLTQTARDERSVHEAQLSVTYEILFIMAILMVLIVNLVLTFSGNLKLLFNNETRVLEQVSRGDLSAKVPVATHDEFGVIADHTNHMIDGLRHRFALITSLKLAEEVQQNLLPENNPTIAGFDIVGTSIYCDQTGGDYYDYIPLPGDKLGIVVADACGHGISAAMLMTSMRAYLAAAAQSYLDPADLAARINVSMVKDYAKSSRFTSMFFLEIASRTKSLRWVRAGHDPAIRYHAATGSFSRLDGPGLVLGIDSSFVFQNCPVITLQQGDIILIGTDGIHETHNGWGEVFGSERLEAILRDYADETAAVIQDAVVKQVKEFRGQINQEDDITLVVLKSV